MSTATQGAQQTEELSSRRSARMRATSCSGQTLIGFVVQSFCNNYSNYTLYIIIIIITIVRYMRVDFYTVLYFIAALRVHPAETRSTVYRRP